MAVESWIVTNQTGERIGLVRKLVLDARAGVTHAEVALVLDNMVVRSMEHP
jgi:hypothetical protein